LVSRSNVRRRNDGRATSFHRAGNVSGTVFFDLDYSGTDATLRAKSVGYIHTPSLRTAFSARQRSKGLPMSSPYRAPLFLLSPPEDPNLPYKFELPTLERPSSQLCTYNQLVGTTCNKRAAELGLSHALHRKHWEWCYILQVMHVSDTVHAGTRAIGFGIGRESLPSYLASQGVTVLATDAPTDLDQNQAWSESGQHSQAVLDLHNADLVSKDQFLKFVSFRAVDMNTLPEDLADFDVCWSSCCFEHLGSLDAGLLFVENSLKCLRPGGIAVHTTEFNLDSNESTFETSALCIYRRKDIERLCSRLTADGHDVWPLNFHPGYHEIDQVIDMPPWSLPHIKLKFENITTTSIGIVVRKRLP
jgi:SAM-dependent methyltransferase